MTAAASLNNFLVISDDHGQLFNYVKANCTSSKASNESQTLEFTLNTKYYSATVQMSIFDSLRSLAIWRVSNKEIQAQSFCYCMKRSQLVFDLTKVDELTNLFEFDSKIISCYLSSLPQPFAATLSRWANEKGFEIVDLEPSADDVEYFKEVNERYGFDRIIEILEGTTWPKKQAKALSPPSLSGMRIRDDKISEEPEEFDGTLDDNDKKMLESLMGSESIIEYYIKQGLDCYGIDGELSKIEEQEANEKKAKAKAKKKAKAKAKKAETAAGANDLSDDVGIELDKDEEAPEKVEEDQKTVEEDQAVEERAGTTDAPAGDTYNMVEKCLKTMLNAQGHVDDNIGMEIIGELKDLKEDLAHKPRDYRLAMAEMVSNAVLKQLLKDEEEEGVEE